MKECGSSEKHDNEIMRSRQEHSPRGTMTLMVRDVRVRMMMMMMMTTRVTVVIMALSSTQSDLPRRRNRSDCSRSS